jgi:hypothetical protein
MNAIIVSVHGILLFAKDAMLPGTGDCACPGIGREQKNIMNTAREDNPFMVPPFPIRLVRQETATDSHIEAGRIFSFLAPQTKQPARESRTGCA